MRFLAFLCILALACDDRRFTRIEITPLAEGEWIVVDAADDDAILRRMHSTRQPQRRGSLPATPLAVLGDTLQTIRVDTVRVTVGDSMIPFLHLRDRGLYFPLYGQPHLIRSPAHPRTYAFEHADAIWLLLDSVRQTNTRSSAAIVRKLTNDEDVQVLRGQQREGVAILYWSTHPVWSSDGKLISFISNREAFRGGVQGQSLWIIDATTGAQKALYNPQGVSVRTEGTLGPEFIFISSSEPGVFSIHPQIGQVTRRANGYVAGTHPRGEVAVINDDGRLVVLRDATIDTLPDPPVGRTWNPSAFVSPSGQNIALFSSDNKGDYTLHVFQHNNDRVLSVAVPGGPSYGPVWGDDDTIIFAAMRIGGELTTYRADLR